MVALNRIYTRTGDNGETGLASGPRRSKADLRIETIGTVDETNAALGLARLHAEGEMDAALSRIQNDLFDLGADLATPETGELLPYEPLRIVEAQVARLEQEIDAMNIDIAPLRSFILPGGSPLAVALHLARTICRRAERLAVALSLKSGETVSEPALKYLNRLSDYLFVAARAANENGAKDVLWIPGKNR